VNELLFIGSNGYVCAIDPESGKEVWRRALQKGVFNATTREDVSVLVRNGIVYAGSQGHLFALAADTGEILWHNSLSGLGFNDIALAFEGHSIQYLQKTRHTNTHSSNP
jgi:outer membrane protein assembly factor BamB